MARRLVRTSERQFKVMDGDVHKGFVWRCGTDADDAKRWRTASNNGVEWRAWQFFATPQAAAVAACDYYDRASK